MGEIIGKDIWNISFRIYFLYLELLRDETRKWLLLHWKKKHGGADWISIADWVKTGVCKAGDEGRAHYQVDGKYRQGMSDLEVCRLGDYKVGKDVFNPENPEK